METGCVSSAAAHCPERNRLLGFFVYTSGSVLHAQSGPTQSSSHAPQLLIPALSPRLLRAADAPISPHPAAAQRELNQADPGSGVRDPLLLFY